MSGRVISFIKTASIQFQCISFAIGKCMLGIVELPHNEKKNEASAFLFISLVLLTLSACIKYLRRSQASPSLFKMLINAYIVLLTAALNAIFAWGLCDSLKWNFLEKLLMVLCLAAEAIQIVFLTCSDPLTKREHASFEIILGLSVLILAAKTVGFINNNAESPYRDIVLLNLTTQITVSLLFMDLIDRARDKTKALMTLRTQTEDKTVNLVQQRAELSARLEQELVQAQRGAEDNAGMEPVL